MTFAGTNQWEEAQVVNHIDSLGGRWNAYTSREVTSYYATVPVAKLSDMESGSKAII
jgi:predicted Zn-dependent peptidase